MVQRMNVSVVYTGVRVTPEIVVQISAVADGKPIRVDLDRDAIDRLMGPAVGDEKAMLSILARKRETIRAAIEASVFARGAPFDGHLVLAWRDLSAFAGDPTASSAPVS